MKCKKCGTDFEGNFCPQCGSTSSKVNKKTLYKKWWFWVIIVLVFFYIVGTLGGDPATEEPTNGQDQSVTQTDDTQTTTQPEKDAEQENTPEPTPEKDPVQIKSDYIASCESVAYEDIARYPDNYNGKNIKFRGEVMSVTEALIGSTNTYLIQVTENEYGFWDDSVYVRYSVPEGGPNVLEDDIVTFYGRCTGTTTYTTVLGAKVTIPSVDAKYIEIEE